MFKNAFFIVLITAAASLFADNTATKHKMINVLESIRFDFEVGYAPKAWKKEHINWDLDEQFEIAKKEILDTENITVAQYQQILKKFFQSTRDFHVGIGFYSTEAAELPISVKSVDNHLYIVYVNSNKINTSIFPLSVGDEVVSVNGVPAMDALIEFQKQAFNYDGEGSERALAQSFFTRREGRRGHAIPSGPVSIEVRSPDSDDIRSIQLCWEHTPEMITADVNYGPPLENKIPDFQFIGDFEAEFDYFDENPFLRGVRVGYLPSLGKKIWEASFEDLFHAYIYQTKDRELVGYIRLSTFSPFFPELFVDKFKEIIAHMEDATDALVIDQTNNPGGSLFYLYAIASLLTDKPLFTPKHKFSINQEHVFEAVYNLEILEKIRDNQDAVEMFGREIEGYPVSYQFTQMMKNYYRFILNEWKAKKTLTEPHYLWGVDRIAPHPTVHYTKPIVLLVDDMDFSGGDFFPAIMQDNKRAVIMGSRTAGAGGYVRPRMITNTFGVMMYRYTESVALRLNNEHLENLGVTPDVEYHWTVDDVQNGFHDYADAINAVVSFLLNPPESN